MVENSSNYTKEEKDKLIKKEITRLKRNYKDLERAKKENALSLISNAAFMSVTLMDLQETINTQGTVSEYQNGENQWGTKKSPEVEIYNTMIKNYAAIMKQLDDLLPKREPKPEDDGFDSFVGGREDD